MSGLVAAWLLAPEHDLTVFEANDYVGGHTNTIRCEVDGETHAVDTGFIVYNEKTYPNFVRLLDRLSVATQPSTMSFSVVDQRDGLEYAATSIDALFAQRRNLLRPGFYGMIRDIYRFFRESRELLATPNDDITLADYVRQKGFGRAFVEQHLIPIGAAIWSADPRRFGLIPARFFVQFLENHGMLQADDRPPWRVVRGGSHEYVRAIVRPFREAIRLSTPVEAVTRHADRVEVRPRGGRTQTFDRVVIATHSDQALRMLTDATDAEREILGAIPYQPNDTVLHTDERLLPTRRKTWASWNYLVPAEPQDRVAITYHMNTLQSIKASRQFCVTLNRTGHIDPGQVLRRLEYHHPIFTAAGVAAQQQRYRINGENHTYYCGAYWGNGFHEDGVRSALAVAELFGKSL